MRQIICDKCKATEANPYHCAVNISFGGTHKCTIDLCKTCLSEFGIEANQYNRVQPDASVKLLESLKEFIAENMEELTP